MAVVRSWKLCTATCHLNVAIIFVWITDDCCMNCIISCMKIVFFVLNLSSMSIPEIGIVLWHDLFVMHDWNAVGFAWGLIFVMCMWIWSSFACECVVFLSVMCILRMFCMSRANEPWIIFTLWRTVVFSIPHCYTWW